MRFVLSLALLLVLCPPAFAQTAPACNGDIAIVRVSEIKPGGSIAGFMDAMKDHIAWYRANGVTDNGIFAARVFEMDEDGNIMKYSDKEVMTYHVNPPEPERTPNRGDAAWSAYVKKYGDNSNIKSEYITCMPKMSK